MVGATQMCFQKYNYVDVAGGTEKLVGLEQKIFVNIYWMQ